MTDTDTAPSLLLEKLDRLRTELAELAFFLERRGRLDAADVTLATAARIAELCEEFAPGGSDHSEKAAEAEPSLAAESARCTPCPEGAK